MTHLRLYAGGLLAAMAVLLLCPFSGAQEPNLGAFDPSDVYFQAWLTLRDAEKEEQADQFLEAFKTYDKAKKLFDSVALHHPEWKADLVKDRQKSTASSMESIRDMALEEQRQMAKKTDDLVEGPEPRAEANDLTISRLTPDEMKQVAALQTQIMQYRTQLERARTDRDANAARLRRALAELEAKRDQLARAPVTGQMRDLESRIDRVERERDANATALRQSRLEHQEVLTELATLKADAGAAKARATELQKNIDVQQRAANQVVEGLRRQLKNMEARLAEKDKKYTAVLAQSELLKRQLEESRAEISDLQEERDTLLKERDQMAALLKLNESERVQLLIEQNMDLGRDLKKARDRVQELFADNNTTKDELTVAKRDLSVAKARIIELRNENESQKSRLASLERKLELAGKELNMDLSAGDLDPRSRQEMEMLRDIIARQLRVQERRRQARDAVMAEVQRIGIEDNAFQVALDIFSQQELKLTDEESQLIKEFKVDQQFIFNDRPSQEELVNAGQRLQQSIGDMGKAARRAFSKSRFLAAREMFESILEEHPGHVPTMLNLGVVHLKNDEVPLAINAFNDALVIRGNNVPFAQFMLGVCHYRLQDFPQARNFLLRAVDQDPGHAKAHVFLGSIAGLESQLDGAETHFKQALRLDPTLTEPYYNLALIYDQKGNKAEALRYYTEALKNGAQPDLALEESIRS